MKNKNALIVFQKNLIQGKVKTRLAKDLGDAEALYIYTVLVVYTRTVVNELHCDKFIFYSDDVEQNDDWKNEYNKAVQQGNNLGGRMKYAFETVLQNGYEKAIIIGTDCPMLTAKIIEEAFKKLNKNDVVIGASADGGYYLLGMQKMQSFLFENIAWSTASVFASTISQCKENKLSYFVLPTLHDVDIAEDLRHMKHLLHE